MAESKYALLIQLAEDRQQAAAERMQQAQARLNEANARMEQLQAFRGEYRHKLTDSSQQGISVTQYQDFRRFLLRLDEAVETQQLDVDRCLQRYLLERQAWQGEHKKLKAFEKLLQREQARAQVREARLQQKISDEFATRRFWDAKHAED